MPTFDYQCTNDKCNHVFEEFLGVHENDPNECPECKHPAHSPKKIVGNGGTVGVRFVGAGFYCNDSRCG